MRVQKNPLSSGWKSWVVSNPGKTQRRVWVKEILEKFSKCLIVFTGLTWKMDGKPCFSPSKMICIEFWWYVQSIPPIFNFGGPPWTTNGRTAKLRLRQRATWWPWHGRGVGPYTDCKSDDVRSLWRLRKFSKTGRLRLQKLHPNLQTHHLTPPALWCLIHCHNVKLGSIDPDLDGECYPQNRDNFLAN